MNFILHMIEHTIKDTWTMFPLLLLTYIVLEIFERRETNDDKIFFGLQKYGPLLGALIGLLPQCGFSVLAAILYCQNNISLGTMIAVMVATSDEAIPILVANPSMYDSLIRLLALKFIIALISGYVIDLIIKPHIIRFEDMIDEEEIDDEQSDDNVPSQMGCNCCYPQYPLIISALLRSLKIFVFLFITSFVITIVVEQISEESLSMILMNNSMIQPVIAALFGFIPNCAATVVLSQLFASGQIHFGSLLSGLVTNAGLGLIALFSYSENKKEVIKVMMILMVIGTISGMICYVI